MAKVPLRARAASLVATVALALGVTASLLCASCDSSVSSSVGSVRSIGVTADPSVIFAGSTGQMTAVAVFPDGTSVYITDQVRWTSSNSRVATVANDGDSSGLVAGVAAGTVTISAQLNGITGSAQLQVVN